MQVTLKLSKQRIVDDSCDEFVDENDLSFIHNDDGTTTVSASASIIVTMLTELQNTHDLDAICV